MFTQVGNRLCRRGESELLWIEPWGPNALRVRATPLKEFEDDTDTPSSSPAEGVAARDPCRPKSCFYSKRKNTLRS